MEDDEIKLYLILDNLLEGNYTSIQEAINDIKEAYTISLNRKEVNQTWLKK